MTAIFDQVNHIYKASELGCAGWYPNVLHGGVVAGLVAHECFSFPTSKKMRMVRFTLDIIRPVLKDQLKVKINVIRDSRNLQVLEAELHRLDKMVAKASMLKVRDSEFSDLEEHHSSEKLDFPEIDDEFSELFSFSQGMSFAKDAVDIRRVEGIPFIENGPGSVWIRPKIPLIHNSPLSPELTAVIISDFGNAISSVLPVKDHVFINADLGVQFYRYPKSQWIGLKSETLNTSDGVGLVHSKLYDLEGLIGIAHQGLVMDTRDRFFQRRT